MKLDESSKQVTEFCVGLAKAGIQGRRCSASRDFHRSHKISFDHNILHKSSQDGQDGLIGFALKLCSF